MTSKPESMTTIICTFRIPRRCLRRFAALLKTAWRSHEAKCVELREEQPEGDHESREER